MYVRAPKRKSLKRGVDVSGVSEKMEGSRERGKRKKGEDTHQLSGFTRLHALLQPWLAFATRVVHFLETGVWAMKEERDGWRDG